MMYEHKKLFVKELGEFFVKHNFGSIESMTYVSPGAEYIEEVRINYAGGHVTVVNVTFDSIEEILRELVRQDCLC